MLDCQLEQAYSEAEWQAFVACAREGMESGERLDDEFYPKIAGHGRSDREVALAVRRKASLVTYEKDGAGKLAVWDPDSKIFVIARLPSGSIFNAFKVQDFDEYVKGLEGRVLKR